MTTGSNWPIYSLKLKSRSEVAERTLEFRFENPNFTFIPTMTQMSGSHLPWQGETGYIDHGMIAKYLQSDTSPGSNPTGPIYYIAGPPQMVAGIRMMLNKAGIDDDDIRTEEFTDY